MEEYSNKVANVFSMNGLEKGNAVALFLENRPEYICFWLGLSKLGIITPLINYNLRQNPLLHSIKASGCQAIIFSSDLATGEYTQYLSTKYIWTGKREREWLTYIKLRVGVTCLDSKDHVKFSVELPSFLKTEQDCVGGQRCNFVLKKGTSALENLMWSGMVTPTLSLR